MYSPEKGSPRQHTLVYKVQGGYEFLQDSINDRLGEINGNGGQVWGIDIHDQSGKNIDPWPDYRSYMVVITYDMEKESPSQNHDGILAAFNNFADAIGVPRGGNLE